MSDVDCGEDVWHGRKAERLRRLQGRLIVRAGIRGVGRVNGRMKHNNQMGRTSTTLQHICTGCFILIKY